MKKFARIRKSTTRAYSKVHICGISNSFEVVAVCWYALNHADVEWVGEDYRGKLCKLCEKICEVKTNGYKRGVKR